MPNTIDELRNMLVPPVISKGLPPIPSSNPLQGLPIPPVINKTGQRVLSGAGKVSPQMLKAIKVPATGTPISGGVGGIFKGLGSKVLKYGAKGLKYVAGNKAKVAIAAGLGLTALWSMFGGDDEAPQEVKEKVLTDMDAAGQIPKSVKKEALQVITKKGPSELDRIMNTMGQLAQKAGMEELASARKSRSAANAGMDTIDSFLARD